MGQVVAHSQEQLQFISRQVLVCKSVPTSDPSSEFASEYLGKFVDGSEHRPREAAYLRERHAEYSCCDSFSDTTSSFSPQLGTAEEGQQYKTDIRSLTDLNGDGVQCQEIVDAICMNGAVQHYNWGRDEDPFDQTYVRNDPAEDHNIHVPGGLRVPSEFSLVRYNWLKASRHMEEQSQVQLERLQRVLKAFVRMMLVGVHASLKLDSNAENPAEGTMLNLDCKLVLSDDLARLTCEAGGVRRSLHVRSIRWLRPMTEGTEEECERCVVMRFVGGRIICITFDHPNQAACFGTCMRLLVKAARSDPKRTERV